MRVLLVLLMGCYTLYSQTLRSGPMVGYVHMREAMIWVQTIQPALVQVRYHDIDSPKVVRWSPPVTTTSTAACTGHLLLDQVFPGRTYLYSVWINKKEVSLAFPTRFHTPPLWQWRTDPPVIRILAGSCVYANDSAYDRPGKPYGKDTQIFSTMSDEESDIMLWLGDNIYLREADWSSRTGIFYRYSHARMQRELAPLLASRINLAIWDDHDYGPNDADRSYSMKEVTLEAFKLFWANPRYGLDGSNGIFTTYEYGDVQIFMLDNRWFRTPNFLNTAQRQILGEQQLNWLIEALKSSQATFRLVAVGGQVLNPFKKYETWANVAPQERDTLISRIRRERIPGVLFIDGDRHHSELSVLKEEGYYPLYDLTVSPLSSTANDASDEPNTLRVPGTMTGENNYALIEVSGPRKKRVLNISVRGADGQEKWNYLILATDLQP